MDVGVVAGAEGRLRICAVGVEVRGDGDLVAAADRGQDCADAGIGEGGVQLGGAVASGGAELTGGRMLDRNEPGRLPQSPHRLLVDRFADCGGGETWRDYCDLVTGVCLRWVDQLLHSATQATEATARQPDTFATAGGRLTRCAQPPSCVKA